MTIGKKSAKDLPRICSGPEKPRPERRGERLDLGQDLGGDQLEVFEI
jgi:hypothetical protein